MKKMRCFTAKKTEFDEIVSSIEQHTLAKSAINQTIRVGLKKQFILETCDNKLDEVIIVTEHARNYRASTACSVHYKPYIINGCLQSSHDDMLHVNFCKYLTKMRKFIEYLNKHAELVFALLIRFR